MKRLKKSFRGFAIIAIIAAVIVFSVTACPAGYESVAPVLDDFEITGTSWISVVDGPEADIKIEAKEGKTRGKITIWYTGIGDTIYDRSDAYPNIAGTYRVTFDVIAHLPYWKAASGLIAGILTISDDYIDTLAEDFIISEITQHYNGRPRLIIITAKADKSQGDITIYYESADNPVYKKSETPPTLPGEYTVTFDVAAIGAYKAGEDLSGGTLTITNGVFIPPELTLTAGNEQFSYSFRPSVPAADSYTLFWIQGGASGSVTLDELKTNGTKVTVTGNSVITGLTNGQTYSAVLLIEKQYYDDVYSNIDTAAPNDSITNPPALTNFALPEEDIEEEYDGKSKAALVDITWKDGEDDTAVITIEFFDGEDYTDTPTDAGEYLIVISTDETDNFAEADRLYTGINLIIKPAKLTGEVSEILFAEVGDTLAHVFLTELHQYGNESGTFAWKEPLTPVGEVGDNPHTAIFTPDDPNYALTEVTIIINVGPNVDSNVDP